MITGNLMVVALANIEGLKRVASFTLANLYRPDDTIHTTYVEDTAGTGDQPGSTSYLQLLCGLAVGHLKLSLQNARIHALFSVLPVASI